jgi:hypothetical protein
VALVVTVVVPVAVVLVAGCFALVVVLDERERLAEATALAPAEVRLAALAEDDALFVVEDGLLEPQAAIRVASTVPSPSAVAVGRIFIGRV